MLSRRGLIGSLLAAPAIIRLPGLLMPIKPLPIVRYGKGGMWLPTDSFTVYVDDMYTFAIPSGVGKSTFTFTDFVMTMPNGFKVWPIKA